MPKSVVQRQDYMDVSCKKHKFCLRHRKDATSPLGYKMYMDDISFYRSTAEALSVY